MNMNFIVWKCRGAQLPDFRRNFRSILDYHRPSLVALLETHLSDHQALREDFEFFDMAQVFVEGQSGGIVLLWHRKVFTMDILANTSHEVHCMIKVSPHPQKWLFSVVYAITHYQD